MLAFHNNEEIQEKYLKRVQKHYEMDEIVQGVYWENGKGCAVGCTIETSTNPHKTMEKELGIPEDLSFLEDTLFEGLSNGRAKEFPLQFLSAIPLGADLSKVTAQFMVWQYEDEVDGLKNLPEVKDNPELQKVCEDLVALYQREIDGKEVSHKEWVAVYERAGAWAGAWAGAGAWAWARARARAGAWAWARARAWEEAPYWEKMADKLIELLKAAPIKEELP